MPKTVTFLQFSALLFFKIFWKILKSVTFPLTYFSFTHQKRQAMFNVLQLIHLTRCCCLHFFIKHFKGIWNIYFVYVFGPAKNVQQKFTVKSEFLKIAWNERLRAQSFGGSFWMIFFFINKYSWSSAKLANVYIK